MLMHLCSLLFSFSANTYIVYQMVVLLLSSKYSDFIKLILVLQKGKQKFYYYKMDLGSKAKTALKCHLNPFCLFNIYI